MKRKAATFHLASTSLPGARWRPDLVVPSGGWTYWPDSSRPFSRFGRLGVARRISMGASSPPKKPGDFDACWEASGVDASRLDSALLTFANRRAAQKSKFGGELFPAESAAAPDGTRLLEYFQRDSRTGEAKGIVAIESSTL